MRKLATLFCNAPATFTLTLKSKPHTVVASPFKVGNTFPSGYLCVTFYAYLFSRKYDLLIDYVYWTGKPYC